MSAPGQNRWPLFASFGGAIVGWGLLFWLLGLWDEYWWLGLLVIFTLITLLVDRLGHQISPQRRAGYERLLAIGFPLLLLIAWEWLVRGGVLNARWFPPPTRIAAALVDLTVTYDQFNETSLIGRPWLIPQRLLERGWPGVAALFAESHVFATLSRVFLGFFIGAIPGLLIGLLMGMNRTIRLMLDTTMSAAYVLPKIAIFPIMMLLFADPFGEGPKVAVVAISAFFLVAINTMVGVRDIEPVLIQAGRNYGARGWRLLYHVIIPGALPVIFAGLRLALGTALIVIVAIEFVRARKGVGFMTYYYWEILSTEKMYAGLVVVMILGVLLTHGLQWLEKRVMPWDR